MVSFETHYYDPENHICHVRCNTNDTKPANVGINSDLVEVNEETGEIKFYIFTENKEWVEIIAL